MLLAEALGLGAEDRAAFERAAARPGALRAGDARTSIFNVRPATRIWNATDSLTSFVGRQLEVIEIAELVRSHRLVTIAGAGGVGKTRAGTYLGSVLSEGNLSTVWFVRLASVRNAPLVALAVASAFGIQKSSYRSLYHCSKELLLILDNCEHVVAEVASFAGTLLQGCPRLRILATSREPLGVAGEFTYRLPSLAVPSIETADRLGAARALTYPSIELFVHRARAAENRFALTDENAPMVAAICRRLDGIPLALELAAARVTTLFVTALAAKLDERFRILTRRDRMAVPEQPSMALRSIGATNYYRRKSSGCSKT